MNRHYARVAQRAGHRCEYCHAPEAIFNLAFEVEHIVPQSQGGPDDESNLALACRACNLYKSDQQTEHFRVEPEQGAIQGLTRIGCVTAACLRMNRDVHREARLSWMQLKLYP